MLLLEDLNRRVATETQAVLFARAMGENVPVPDPAEIRHRFDTMLAEEPAEAQPDSRGSVLAEAFGLRG